MLSSQWFLLYTNSFSHFFCLTTSRFDERIVGKVVSYIRDQNCGLNYIFIVSQNIINTCGRSGCYSGWFIYCRKHGVRIDKFKRTMNRSMRISFQQVNVKITHYIEMFLFGIQFLIDRFDVLMKCFNEINNGFMSPVYNANNNVHSYIFNFNKTGFKI